ncbi:hypothetical protein K2173_025138 [Erythroxylum novogranatense]|uniref:Glycosyl transferase family 1 domain-containing protein n=1 Tax=Erythroxylum novogranatense TaxID=1862640 RepID=A0AAV8SVK3_9ROSI|nr:hypothetical protein K2173_025138 [Erythroxylum novogranatense]
MKTKSLAFYLSSISILFLAILLSFTSTKTNYIKVQFLKSSLASQSGNFKKLLGFLYPNPTPAKTLRPNPTTMPSHCVLWMAPFLSGGGYSSEAWSYILALTQHIKDPKFRLCIEQHGDLESLEFWEGLPEDVRSLAIELHQTQCRMNETIVVCHSEPGAWHPPLFETLPCPPNGYNKGFRYVIGRTMFETDRVNTEHVKRCNRMDYVWVPTDFHLSTFVESGVNPSKIVKIVQPVDIEFFDPIKYDPLDLVSRGNMILGEKNTNLKLEKEFVFLSVFKWEYRKGWDVLLKSYLKEFSGSDEVALYLLTNPYHSDSNFGNRILEFVEYSDLRKPENGWASVYVIDSHIAQSDLPRMFKAANAFVLPSRGEGWGRPVVEAMSMSLPVITTNWSGPTEYLTEENSYPLPFDRMTQVMEGPFQGHLWAEPSVDKLQVLMRRVITNVEEAQARGKRAREDMIKRFSPSIVAKIVANQVQTILDRTI